MRVWFAATMLVAALVHTGTIRALPRMLMSRALARTGISNLMHYRGPADASSRGAARPNPDMLYALCPFDLTKGPVRLTAHVPHSTYWSVTAYDAASNVFFDRTDRQIGGDSIAVVALRRGEKIPPLGDATERAILIAPTAQGLFVVRLLIDDNANLAALQAIQHRAVCGTTDAPAVPR